MITSWTQEHLPNGICLHTSTAIESHDIALRNIIEKAAEKAISLLDTNIQDDSLYLMFEWNPTEHHIHIVVCNAQKSNDAPQHVRAYLQGTNTHTPEELKEQIHYWLHDYLTTCTAFFRYSLVAVFHTGDRDRTELL